MVKIAPENWYVILKNPVKDNKHPLPGTSNSLPEGQEIGRKINIRGPISFALYPGQMAKIVKGYALKTNEYLLARVYDADSANIFNGKTITANGQEKENEKNVSYITGQLLVIKGTEVSFYIPPTGIEVIPIEENKYVRDAVTLERLEYCILKDEDGNKRYVHGPDVVFPSATEHFITSESGNYIFKAIELSPISGIYVKIIAEYTEGEVTHPIGEELFITGKDQKIYYPRPEHAITKYSDKVTHHAIAIPKGEGKYVMNKLTGEISTIKGPAMFLPDPRTHVAVQRKLSAKECSLYYPGNENVLLYNLGITNANLTKIDNKPILYCSSSNDLMTDDGTFVRNSSYTKPRTIVLDNKYEGVVSIDVWTGYAVNVVSKNGNREVICGPQTVLLDYDQTLEELSFSTGTPKDCDKLINTVYLHYKNNKVSDIISVKTSDFVKAKIKLSYCIDFKEEEKDKWFNVNNYVKFVCDRMNSLIKKEIKKYTIRDFYLKYSDIICDIVDKNNYFKENGMIISDCEIIDLIIDKSIADLLDERQYDNIYETLDLADAEHSLEITKKLTQIKSEDKKLKTDLELYKLELDHQATLKILEAQSKITQYNENEKMRIKQFEKELQFILMK